MITSDLNPVSAGLPGEDEVASWALEYFPEFKETGKYVEADSYVQYPAYSPVVSQNGAGSVPGGQRDVNSSQTTGRNAYAGSRSIDAIRADFPILSQKVDGRDLIWLDNGATTQKPRQVIDRISYFYKYENSNVHRGAHTLAARATDAYEAARQKTANFLGAPSAENIVFVRGTTEGINLVANAYVKPLLKSGSEIILTLLEHHANIVPWQ
jgi:cysteine desulfurase/selenocysteine lyase